MQVTITVTRKTRYSSIVEMSQEEYDRLAAAIDAGSVAEYEDASEELNRKINVSDWQDDELDALDVFEPFKPTA